ncbi:MAG: fumarylacetoacetate hydrolase family protein [Chloroflexota bacterium]|nr:fumarylacetoacetate hydrolase family protein [Chloroflexota bacterium]
MKLATFTVDGSAPRVGVVVEDMVTPLDCADMLQLITSGEEELLRLVANARGSVPVADAHFCAPILNPGKIICIGLNYRDHAAESGAEVPQVPVVFAKWANTLTGHGDPIRIPCITGKPDYEAELAVIIGRTGRDIPSDEALDYVFGYTNCHDVSARDLQFSEGGQWTHSKTLDTFAPMGPYLVTKDDIPDPQALRIRCILNGETMQDSNTSEMIFPVAELIAFLSRGMTLECGDIISTGTPAGVGTSRKPPVFLKAGDEVSIEIEGLGRLTNPVVQE